MAQQSSRRSSLSTHAADTARSAHELTQYEAQQHALAQAVRAGKLWMDTDVAAEAAARCDAFAAELQEFLDTSSLTTMHSDPTASQASATYGEAYTGQIERFVEVVQRMADTYREAGGLTRQP